MQRLHKTTLSKAVSFAEGDMLYAFSLPFIMSLSSINVLVERGVWL